MKMYLIVLIRGTKQISSTLKPRNGRSPSGDSDLEDDKIINSKRSDIGRPGGGGVSEVSRNSQAHSNL